MIEQPLNQQQPRLDWLMLAAVAGLMLIGVAFIYSTALANEVLRAQVWTQQIYFKQAVWYFLGIIAGTVLCLVSYHTLARWALVAYIGAMLLLVAVLVPLIGTTQGWGARRWIDLGPMLLQPSEVAKLAFILAMAHFLSRPLDELRQPKVFWKAIGMTALPTLLIIAEPDLGSAIIFFPIGLAMLFAAGTPPRFLKLLIGGLSLVAVLFLVDILFAPPGWQIKLHDYQRRRLLVYFGKEFAPSNATAAERQRLLAQQRNDSYNVQQALISVGSGGLTGKGWRRGTQIALGYLPRAVAHNDFIFSVIAEESGFVGSAIVVALYGVVLFCGINIAAQARDRLGKLLAVGVVALLFSHVFINIGMNIRLMPVTGVPLPLLSYGGSSALCSLIAIGLLQNVYLHRRSY